MAYELPKEYDTETITLRDLEAKIYSGGKLTEQEEQVLLKKIDEYWDNHPDVELRFPRWKKYMAWICGYQFYDYNKYTKKLIEIPLRRKRKLIFNRLRPFVRTLLSKLNADIPTMSTIPKTTDYDDIEAARVGDKVIEHLREKVDFDQMLTNIKLWAIVLNRAFIRVYWNKDDYGIIDYKREEGFDEMGEPTGESIVEIRDPGDIGMESVSPLQCRADPLYFEREKWRWFLYGEEVDADKIEDDYGIEKGTLRELSSTYETAYDLEYYDEHEVLSHTASKTGDVAGRTIVFKEFWTPKVFIYVAGNHVLDYGVNEWEEIPFYNIEERLIPVSSYEKGFQFNDSLVKDAIAIQREYNRFKSLQSLSIERASKLKILVPFGSLVSKKTFTNDYGVFLDYNPKLGAEPHQMRLDPLPAYAETYVTDLEREFEVAFGAREASFGRLPERASHASGTLVNLLLEQDEVLLNPLLATINKALSKAWSLILRVVRDNYNVKRFIRFTGDDGQGAVSKFMGADLKGNTDVKVVSQGGLPRSRALKVEYALRLWQSGLLPDTKQVLEIIEFGQVDKVFKDELLHERVAYRENDLIESNPDINPEMVLQWIHPLEDTAAHLKIHQRLRFSPKFDSLNDNQKAAVEALLMQTAQIYQQQMQAQMQMEQQAQESPQKAAPKKAQPAGGGESLLS